LSLSLIKLMPMLMPSMLVMILYQVLRQINSDLSSTFTCHTLLWRVSSYIIFLWWLLFLYYSMFRGKLVLN
jgi:hypothetical protein